VLEGCYENVSDFQTISTYQDGLTGRNMPTSRACRARGIWRTTRQTDKQTALPQQATKLNGEVANILVTSTTMLEDVTRMLQESYEETAAVEFSLNATERRRLIRYVSWPNDILSAI